MESMGAAFDESFKKRYRRNKEALEWYDALAMAVARKTIRIVHENIVFALAVKFLVLALSAAGVANMWEAVFADVGVSVIAILNAMRALKTVK